MLVLSLCILHTLCIPGDGGNVLMYLPVSTRSHLSVWTPLSHGLAISGHNVTVVTDTPSVDPPSTLTEIVVTSKEFCDFQEDYSVFSLSDNKGVWDTLTRVMQGGETLLKVHADALKHPAMQNILHSGVAWDLVITSPLFNEVGVMLGDYFQAPTILYLPANAEQLLSMSLGFPDNLVWSGPGAGSIISMVRTYCVNMMYQNYIKESYFVQPQYQELKKHLPNYTLLDYPALERNVDFGFYFSSPHLGQVAARLPNTANLGFVHCRAGGSLPSSLQSWIDMSGEVDIIYMSMGSIFQLPQEVLDTFEQVFSRLKVAVIWKRKFTLISRHLYQSPWLPQQEVLSSPRVRLFISQVGMMSLQESIYHSVPLLGLPLTYEQNMNAEIVQNKGIGVVLDYKQVTVERLEGTIRDILENKTVQKNIERLAELVKDSRTHPLEDALWWCNYVMRYQGCEHFKSVYRHSPLLHYYSMDILLYVSVHIAIAIALLWSSVKYVKYCVTSL